MRLKDSGYAEGMYSCTCSTCNKQHMADKRASNCAECAHNKEVLKVLDEVNEVIDSKGELGGIVYSRNLEKPLNAIRKQYEDK